MKLRYKLTGIFLALTVFITVAFYLLLVKNQQKDFEAVADEHLKNIEVTFRNLQERDTKLLLSTLEVIVQDPGIKEVYREGDREKLFNYGHPLFQRLKEEYGITHWYFINPEGRVFLRMHNKTIYGDLVERHSFVSARDSRGPGWEIELGKTAFALRTVMPYVDEHGNLIGYVELAEEIEHFLEILKKETRSEFALFADKEYLDRDDWISVRQVAGLPDPWDEMEMHVLVSRTDKHDINGRCFVEEKLERAEEGEHIFEQMKSSGRAFMCAGFTLKDERQRHIGAILFLADITGHVAVAKEANDTILLMSVILFFGILAAGMLISSSITNPIKKLAEVAKAVGRGDLKRRVEVASNDEIGYLGRSFNAMMERREQAEKELIDARNHLEERVKQRTADLTSTNEQLKKEIHERRQVQHELMTNQKRLETIREIGALATSTLELKDVLHHILRGTLEATGATVGMIFLKDEKTGCLSWGASIGLSEEFVADYTKKVIRPGEGLSGLIAETGKPIYIPIDASRDERVVRAVAISEGFNSFIGIPIFAAGEIVGVINILTRPPDILGEDVMKLLIAIGSHIGPIIQNARLFEEQKHAEEKILMQNKYLNSLMESFTHPLYVINVSDYTVKMANAASRFGPLKRDSKCYVLTHKRDRPCEEAEHPCMMKEILRTKQPVIIEHTHFDEDGNPRIIEAHGYPMYDNEGNIVEILEYTIDITERKKQEEELMRASNFSAIGRLAVGIAHEINNPLTNASLGMQILKNRLGDIKADMHLLQKFNSVERSVDRASVIAKELLKFSRQKDIELSSVNINDLILGALTLMEFKLNNITIQKDLADIPEITGDPIKLEQVFINVLNNSAEAMPEGGVVFISTSFLNKEIMVKISDTGTGIDREDLSAVFEPFFRRKDIGDGTGLGLAISYSIIQQHRGNMEISSIEGKGTTVTITLPVVEIDE